MYRSLLAAVLLSTASFCAQAHSVPELTAEQARTVPYVEIGTYVSEPNEQLTPFLLRTAHVLQNFTAEKKHEACASIAYDSENKTYGIRLISVHSAMMCVVNHKLIPEGMESVRLSIHSHPQGNSVKPSNFDVNVSGGTLSRTRPFPLSRRAFSAPDYAGGPGYVVTFGKLFYQAGKGTDQDMGDIQDTTLLAAPAE